MAGAPTFFSVGLSKENFPNRTWKGEQARDPRCLESAFAPKLCRKGALTIFLFNYHHVDSSTQCGRVDAIPRLRHRTTKAAHILHSVERTQAGVGRLREVRSEGKVVDEMWAVRSIDVVCISARMQRLADHREC